MFFLIVQLALNIKVLNIIKVILFFINFRKKPNLFKKLRNNRLA